MRLSYNKNNNYSINNEKTLIWGAIKIQKNNLLFQKDNQRGITFKKKDRNQLFLKIKQNRFQFVQ